MMQNPAIFLIERKKIFGVSSISPNKPQKFNILNFLMAKLVCFDYRK